MTEEKEFEYDLETTPRWYIVQTYSGYELSVKQDIERRIVSMNMDEHIFKVIVAEVEEEVIDKKTGKQAVDKKGNLRFKKVNAYPGYVFINMIVTEESWYIIRNTPKVTGFLGSSGGGAKPVPLRNSEIFPILQQCGLADYAEIDFEKGEKVTVTSGNFVGKTVVIEEVNGQDIVILVDILGQTVKADVKITDIEKIK